MLVKELIEKLQSLEEMQETEIVFADFEPIRSVYGCELDGVPYVCLTDNEMFSPSQEDEEPFVDYDELMHEQQQRDAEFAEQYAEMMSDIL